MEIGNNDLTHKRSDPKQYSKINFFYIDLAGDRSRVVRDGDTKKTNAQATRPWGSLLDSLFTLNQ